MLSDDRGSVLNLVTVLEEAVHISLQLNAVGYATTLDMRCTKQARMPEPLSLNDCLVDYVSLRATSHASGAPVASSLLVSRCALSYVVAGQELMPRSPLLGLPTFKKSYAIS